MRNKSSHSRGLIKVSAHALEVSFASTYSIWWKKQYLMHSMLLVRRYKFKKHKSEVNNSSYFKNFQQYLHNRSLSSDICAIIHQAGFVVCIAEMQLQYTCTCTFLSNATLLYCTSSSLLQCVLGV